jgi:hypothetical protein
VKNQFVADINDYFKYGLLRLLACRPGMSPLGVWWMLTANDAGTHGNRSSYLNNERNHSACDPELFKLLQRIQNPEKRNVISVQQSGVIPEALYWPNTGIEKRNADENSQDSHQKLVDPYLRILDFQAMVSYLRSCPVVFADPDNGVETKTNSSERVIRWAEAAMLFNAGKSLIVYQHKPQGQSLDAKLPALVGQACDLLGSNAFAIACGGGPKKGEVGFLLVPQKEAETQFRNAAADFLGAYKSFARMISCRDATHA